MELILSDTVKDMADYISIEINPLFTRVGYAEVKNKKVEIKGLVYDKSDPLFFTASNDESADNQAKIIKKLVAGFKLKTAKARIVIPDNLTFSQIVEMPKLKEKELLAAIRYQADEFIPMPIEETSLDLEILKEDPAKNQVLLLIVAASKKVVEHIEKTIVKAGLEPETLENELAAVGRAAYELLPKQQYASLIVNVGFDYTSCYLIDPETSLIVFSRTLKIGYNILLKDIMINMNWDEAKAVEVLKTIGLNEQGSVNIYTILQPLLQELFGEIEKMMVMSQSKYNAKIGQIYTVNFDNLVFGLAQRIQQFTSVPTQSLILQNSIIPNPVSQSFAGTISSFISLIGNQSP